MAQPFNSVNTELVTFETSQVQVWFLLNTFLQYLPFRGRQQEAPGPYTALRAIFEARNELINCFHLYNNKNERCLSLFYIK